MDVVQLLAVGALAAAVAIAVVAGTRIAIARRRRPARRIVVIGVGGAGGNAVDRMVRARTAGVELIACNTDAQVLRQARAPRRIQIGATLTDGLGSGGDPSIGRRAAEEDAERIGRALAGADMVFVTAGLGGGTGSGAAPVVAAQARQAGALTVAVVTRPFAFEGTARRAIADRAAEELQGSVDTLIVVPNDGVRNVVPGELSLVEAFRIVDDILRHAIEGIVEIVTEAGFINLDFADVRSVMQGAGSALMGVGRGSGERRGVEAAREAIGSPLLGADIEGARGILFKVAGPTDLTLAEVTAAADVIRAAADPGANVIFGATFDDRLADVVQVTVIATGFPAIGEVEAGRAVRASRNGARERGPDAPIPDESPPGIDASLGEAEPRRGRGPTQRELDVPAYLRRQVTRVGARSADPGE